MSKSSEDPIASSTTNQVADESGPVAVPNANVVPAKLTAKDLMGGSKMWLLTLVCLLIAVGLVWWSMPDRGLTISIHFPEGHGLQAEDVVRFRGIDVGTVDRVELNSDLTAIDVVVTLKTFAEPLARKGTRFWIVRPSLSFSGVSGLETAVGNKYIGLAPGDPEGPRRFRFEGLASPLPDTLESEGLEIIIRGEKRHSVSEGSPITCRGVEVGHVLSVGLSQDSRHVDVRAKVFEKYRKLVTTNTKFWATSGVDVDFSLGEGLKLDTESLETIARGGVSLLVIESGGIEVNPGHVFDLYSAPEENWYESAKSVRLTSFKLAGAVPMSASWTQKGLFGESQKETTFIGIPFRDSGGKPFVLVPRDMLVLPSKGVEGTLKLFGPKPNGPGIEPSTLDADSETPEFVRLPVPADFTDQWIDASRDVRRLETIESCLAVRANLDGSELMYLDYPIEHHQLTIDESQPDRWFMNRFDGDRRVWHGAPVLSATDGKLIGAISVSDRQATIVKFSETFNLK